MKIRKRVNKETLVIILKAVMRKEGIKHVQLHYSDIEKCKNEEVNIKCWKSGLLGEEIIDIKYIDNEVTI